MVDWDIEVGEQLPRTELHSRWGGAPRGGIEPAIRAESVFVFSKPAVSSLYGYNYDGWQPDGTFHYTGDGQVGDQLTTTGGNKSLLDASGLGRAIRLFDTVGPLVTYVGEMELVGEPPYFHAEAPDRDGETRSVLVFRLRPIGDVHRVVETEADEEPTVIDVPLEVNDVEAYAVSHPEESTSAVRREAALVRDYGQWLGTQGRTARRHRIRLPDGRSLYTDCFDESTGEVLEAKGSAARTFVRAGLGQVLDYSRYVAHERRALLLPTRPADDLVELLLAHGVAVVWQEKAEFLRAEAPRRP